MGKTEVITAPEHQLLTKVQEARRDLQALIELVPEPDDDAWVRIVGTILDSATPEDVDAAWEANGLREHLDQVLTVRGITRMPSSFAEGLGIFLVVDAIVNETDEMVTVTTSSVAVCAQLLKLNSLEAFPIQVIPRQSERPSKAGYFPQHLEIVKVRG